MPHTPKITNWKPKDFFALLRNLREIPPHLYMLSPHQKAGGQGIHFAVAELPDALAKAGAHIPLKECRCNKNAKKPYVILWKKEEAKQKKQRDGVEDARTLIHDLVHRFTDPSIDTLSKELFEVLGVKDFFGIQTYFPVKRDAFTFGARDIREFFSVSSEYYIQGEEAFHAAYKQFLGDTKTTALYRFLKEKLFH